MKQCQACGNAYDSINAKYCSIECARPASKNAKHKLSMTPEWLAWRDMRYRCQRPTHRDYPRYGARGISVCDRWQVFGDFFADMGLKPDPTYSIERIDNDGNYEPTNCKWGTKTEQSRNRRGCWTAEQDNQLRAGMRQGLAYQEIANSMGKSLESICSRSARLKLSKELGLPGSYRHYKPKEASLV